MIQLGLIGKLRRDYHGTLYVGVGSDFDLAEEIKGLMHSIRLGNR